MLQPLACSAVVQLYHSPFSSLLADFDYSLQHCHYQLQQHLVP